jgi:hypothetical protein
MNITKETLYTFDGLKNASRDEVIDFIEQLMKEIDFQPAWYDCKEQVNDYPVKDLVKSKFPFEIADKSTDIQTNWYGAINHCKALGDGWRLPTRDELTQIYKSENDFDKAYYWSSTKYRSSTEQDLYFVGSVNMNSGWKNWEKEKILNNIRVRAVRDIK